MVGGEKDSSHSTEKIIEGTNDLQDDDNSDSDESEEEVWESVAPEVSLEINLSDGPPTKKRRTGIKKEQRLERLSLHKAHLLCLLSTSIHRNRWCNNPQLQAVMLSRLPHEFLRSFEKQKKADYSYLKEIVSLWRTQILVPDENIPNETSAATASEFLDEIMSNSTSEGIVANSNTQAICFESLLRALRISSRLVSSLHPIPLSLSSSAMSSSGNPFIPIRLWSEVFLDNTWIPIDISRNLVDNIKSMEPPASSPKQEQISYVVALEAGFGISDVTRRYTSQWGAKTSRLRLPSGQDGDEWWTRTLWLYSKSHTNEADLADYKLQLKSINNEKMPTSFQGFMNHPLFALERHLKKNEIIYPSGKEHSIGIFRNELVYKREHVQKLMSRIAWLREGYDIKEEEQPIKTQNKRASATNVENDDGESSVVELFGPWQTKKLVRPPLEAGIIPCNRHGNIEIFHPRMIPQDTVHLIIPGIESIAKEFQIHFRRVVTGFEFTQGKARPRYEGIVVHRDFEELLKEASWASHQAKQAKEKEQKETRVLGRWKKFVIALLNKERLLREYAS